MTSIPRVTLNNGVQIPQVGYGVFEIEPARTAEYVRMALDAGYRHIDTAQMYGNEAEVGEAVQASGVPRADVFITTKLDNGRHGRAEAVRALDESLRRLRTDYVDLFLIHWPIPPEDRYVETWEALGELMAGEKTRAIGVSNMTGAQLARLAERSDIVPAVNQVELNPFHPRRELVAYHREHGIATEAWRPIAKGQGLDHPTLVNLAERYGRTPAQVMLRWQIQEGNIVFPKSVTPSRIRENLDVFGFRLADDEMASVAALAGDPHAPADRTPEALKIIDTWSA
ncbi:aldo/keto reductase [Longimicrobium terrae]|uniref:2,5-diketo-D-gluconate reductase A n=1 Tax=Longimicrobium terrae TaxID=1639882 RepID=A0A841H0L0_9BACT|nr:aldo/keto reductase [Longimicrobium terrae]MBB4637115.1 2,5-diketo-D-gluconate reductase A [Longimicrobium terrae]MBB6071625.1 2,5-diketo-D-gluconate reductase A [Longimicrobium terrae]NNC29959.1 aldo/keto reductase [Longimicrobium terrae]